MVLSDDILSCAKPVKISIRLIVEKNWWGFTLLAVISLRDSLTVIVLNPSFLLNSLQIFQLNL
jgi:hypothetical protein